MKLTDAKVRAIKANGKEQTEFDGGGLFLHVSPKGAKSFREF